MIFTFMLTKQIQQHKYVINLKYFCFVNTVLMLILLNVKTLVLDATFIQSIKRFHSVFSSLTSIFNWLTFTFLLILMLQCMCAQLHLTLCDPRDCSPPGSSARRFSWQEYWSGLLFFSPGDHLNLGNQTCVSCIAGRFFTSEPCIKY